MTARLIILLILFTSCNDKINKQPTNETISLKVDSLEKIAFNNYDTKPLKSLEIFKKIAEEYKGLENFRKSGQTNLNIAGIYEERLSEYSKALTYAKKSLKDWALIKDTMQMANLYKYIGYLEGLNTNYEKAYENIKTAINLYEKSNFRQGIAVSNINMAKVQILNSNFEDAEDYYKSSKEFWLEQGNNSRIFDNNLVGIKIYRNINQPEQASNLIGENELILKNEEIDKFLIDKFLKIKKENQ